MPEQNGGTTNPVKYKYTPPKPPVLTPPMNPPNYTPTGSPYGTPAPGPFGGGYNPVVPTPSPAQNYQAPGGYQSGVNGGLMGNLPAPAYGNGYPAPTAAPATGGGGPGYDTWNGYRVIRRAPNGNVLVDVNGEALAYDPWGNHIPHLFFGPGGGDPNGGEGGSGGGGAPAAPTVPAVPTPPGQMPNTFYAPPTASPYLQFGNFLSYMGDAERAQLNDTLVKAGFKPTGAMSTYGNSDYLRPAEFDENDLAAMFQNENVRQWMRFFLGNLGYGIGYQLPAGYQPGSGLPTPPQNPQV